MDAEVRVGADIGGTFTDVALAHAGGPTTAKVLTDHQRPERAILKGIALVLERSGRRAEEVSQVIHGTTLVTNALIERRGARTAFVTTEGFRDVIEMRSENRFEQYDLNLRLPDPLIARRDRFTLPERVAADGSVLLAPDPEVARRLARRIAGAGYESVAVGFLHAYANDAHERLMAQAFAEIAPDLPVSLSSVVSPQMRELPRFNTVVANAYVRPRMAAYLGRLEAALAGAGIAAPLLMMHSGGGLIAAETAAREPVRLLESGPAGGAIFAAGIARAHGIDQALSFDMGGTTAKICLIEDGQPKTATSFEIARSYRFKKGSGMTVSTPVVEMVEIGAGGGSIASVDTLGRVQVGPRSAGSEPGPAAYARGGTEPTVTDANLVLGRLDPDSFAGGAIRLDPDLAADALEPVARALGGDAGAAAFAVTETVDENMANAARVYAVECGRDIERFTMVAFGGGAPLHACRQCEKLGLDAALIPPGAGVGSAIGFLSAPFSYEATRGLYQRMSDFDAAAVRAALAEMEDEASRFVAAARGASAGDTETRLLAYMRYVGQGWEIPVALGRDDIDAGGERLARAFEDAYRRLFGRSIDGLAVEATNWSLTVSTPHRPERRVARETGGRAAPVRRRRGFHDAALRRRVEADEIHRDDMGTGAVVEGPAIIVEDETATVVTSAFRAIGQADGSILLLRKETG